MPHAILAARLREWTGATLLLTEDLRLAAWNDAARQRFGDGPALAVGEPADGLLADPGAGADRLPFAIGTTVRRHRFRRADGTRFEADTLVAPLRVAGARYLRLGLKAPDDRHGADHAVQAKRARHAALIESAPDAIVSFDEDGIVLECNRAAECIFGHDRSRAQGSDVGELLLPPEHRPIVTRSIAAMRLSGEPTWVGHRMEATARHADGHPIPIELSISGARIEGRCIFTAFVRDITGRRRRDAEVGRLMETLQGSFELSPDGCVVFDADDRVTDCNAAFAEMVGHRRDAVIGLSAAAFDALLAGLATPGQACAPVDTLHDGAVDTLEMACPRHQTLQRAVRRSSAGAGPAVGRILYFRDITQEREVDRMKSEFLSMAAHELRTPMVSIHGFSELLMTREFSPARRSDLIATIHRQSSALIELVNELLDLARIEARGGRDLRIGQHALAPLVAETVQALAPGPAHTIETRIDADLPALSVDPDKLQQLLLNVLGNAIKYSPDGGVIVLQAAAERHLGRDMVLIEVTDPGIGMTPTQLKRVFERFFRADPSGGIPGTGLGMAVVREIVQLHQGDIAVDSQRGVGTRVKTWLPAAAPATDAG